MLNLDKFLSINHIDAVIAKRYLLLGIDTTVEFFKLAVQRSFHQIAGKTGSDDSAKRYCCLSSFFISYLQHDHGRKSGPGRFDSKKAQIQDLQMAVLAFILTPLQSIIMTPREIGSMRSVIVVILQRSYPTVQVLA